MSGGAKKSAPREKEVAFREDHHRVLETSFINGSLHHKGAIVQLPKGVKAGHNLELIEDEPEPKDKKDPKDTSGDKK